MNKDRLWKLLAEIRQLALVNQRILSELLVSGELPPDVIPILAEWYRHDGLVSLELEVKLKIIEAVILEEIGLKDETFHTYTIEELLKNAGD